MYEHPWAIFVLLYERTKKPFRSIRHRTCRSKMKCLLQDVHPYIHAACVTSSFCQHDASDTRRTLTLREISPRKAWEAGTPPCFSCAWLTSPGRRHLTCSLTPSTQPFSYVNPDIGVADLRIQGASSTHDPVTFFSSSSSSRSRQVGEPMRESRSEDLAPTPLQQQRWC